MDVRRRRILGVAGPAALMLVALSGRNAWVALHGTDSTPTADLVTLVNEQTQDLVGEGHLALHTSIAETAQLVWERA